MALDKLVDSKQLDTWLKGIGDAIRGKAGTTETFPTAEAMQKAIDAIQAGGGFDPAPFSRIVCKTWVPAKKTSIFKVEDEPQNVLSIRIMFKSIIDGGGGITQVATLYKQTHESGAVNEKLAYGYQVNQRKPPASAMVFTGPYYDDFMGTGWLDGGYDFITGELQICDTNGAEILFSTGLEYAVIIAYGPLK